jgi:Lambda phage tail tape-measure protein (Tape_meas_lam_C)
MPTSTGTIKVALQIDDKGTVRVLKSVGDESTRTGKKGKQAFDKMDKSGKSFAKTGKKVSSVMLKIGAAVGVVAGVLGLAAALRKLTNATKEYVGLANTQEEAETDLQSVLISTGHAAGFSLEQLKAMASGMQDLTKVGDETTLAGMAILATFKQIKGDEFKRSTMSALDMSQVLKQDLKSSMIMIGKAVNDPIKGISALGRAGIQFTEDQKDMIQTMQESGNIVAAQNLILKELESQFGGAAKAASKNFAGGMDQASNALGDVKEEMGFVITKNQFFIELTHLATEEFKSWGKHIKNNREELMLLARNGVTKLVDSIGAGIEVLRFFHNGWMGIKLVGQSAIQGIAFALDATYPLIKNFLKPVDLLFDTLVKLDMLDVNPLDGLEQSLADFKYSSAATTKSILNDIEQNNQRYDAWGRKIDEIGSKMRKLPTGEAKPIDIKAKVIVDTEDAAGKINEFKQNAQESLKNIGIDNRLSDFFGDIERSSADDIKNNLASIRAGANGLYSDLNDKPMWAKFKEGGRMALDSIKQNMMSTADMVSSGIGTMIDGVGNAMGQWVSGAKSFKEAFKDMARSVVQDLISMITKQLLYNAISSIAGGFGGGGGGGGTTAGVMHSGAIVGSHEGDGTRRVPSHYFNNAPRFHQGLLPGEYPAILKRKEGVFTPEQMAALGKNNQQEQVSAPPQVNVTNVNVLDPSIVEEYMNTDDGEQKIVNVMQRNKSVLE